MIIAGRWATIAVLATVILLSTAAHAQALPPIVADNIDAVDGQAEGGGLPNGRSPVDCSTVCGDLLKAERAPAPNMSVRERLLTQLYRMREQARLLPKPVGVLGRVSLVASAFTAGWVIGTPLRKLFFRSEMPGTDASAGSNTVYYVRPIDKGSIIPGSPTNTHIAPSDGWYGLGSCGSPGCLLESSEYDGSCTSLGAIEPAPSGWSWISAPQYFGFNCGPVMLRSMAFRTKALEVVPYTGQTGTEPPVTWPNSSDPGTNGEPTTTTRDRLRDELDNNPDDYDTLLQWLCAHLGGDCDDPTGQLVRVPACRGDTYADCKGNIEAKGLTVQRVDLDFDTADIDVPAERVVKTAPATQADAGSEVKVYVNPNSATMPSAQERDEACELTTPLGHDPAPSRGGDAAPGTPTWIAYFDNYPNDATPQTFKRKTGNLVTDLTGGVDTYLRWGWTKALPEPKRWGGFGYRHIAAKHGWTVADQLATQVALNLPPIDVQGTTYVYLGPEYPGPVAGAICKRRVVVQTRPDYQGKAKEILTSYGQLQSSS